MISDAKHVLRFRALEPRMLLHVKLYVGRSSGDGQSGHKMLIASVFQ